MAVGRQSVVRPEHGLTHYVYKCIQIGMSAVIQHLSEQLRRFRHPHRPAGRLSTGVAVIDRLLSEGLRPGTLMEWLTGGGGGGGTLAFKIVAHLCGASGVCVVIDGSGALYPPAMKRLGVDLNATIVVRPKRLQETLWVWEQSLRCPAVAVVIGQLNRLQTVECRRLQLAAEAGSGVGLLLRPVRDLRESSWADLRFRVTPQPAPISTSSGVGRQRPPPRSRRVQVELLHCRGHFRTGTVLLDIDDETGAVYQVPRLVSAASARRAAGA
jgi:protein ImuA